MTPQPGLSRRHRVLGFVALATLAASIWALGDDDVPESRPVTSRPKIATAVRETNVVDAAHNATGAALTLPVRYGLAVTRRDLFAATASAPASAAVGIVASAALAPPPPPSPAITLPFTFGGRLVTATGPSVLLNEAATTRALALGESLGDFRFERDSGTQLEFVHLPSGERLVLALQP